MKKMSMILVLLIFSISCSLSTIVQIEPTRTPVEPTRIPESPPKPTLVEPTQSDQDEEIKFVPVYWETPEDEVKGTKVSTAPQGVYVAAYLEPPVESGLTPQFLLLEPEYYPKEQAVKLSREISLTQITFVEIYPRDWKQVGMLWGSDTLSDFKAEFGESDLVLYGIQDQSVVNDDLSNFRMVIFDSSFDKVKYGVLERVSANRGYKSDTKRMINNSLLTISYNAVYIPWGVFGRLIEQGQFDILLTELFLKFMCGPDENQPGPCGSLAIEEEFQDQYAVLLTMRP